MRDISISLNPIPPTRVTLNNLPVGSILGMKCSGVKYFVSVKATGEIAMVSGKGVWDNWETVQDMIEDLLEDPHIELVAFDNPDAFAKWITTA